MARVGHSVDVLTSRMKGQASKEKGDGFTVYRVWSWRKGIHDCGFRGAFSYLFFAAFVFLQLTKKNHYDVIHYFFGLPTGFLSLLPGSHKKSPYFISLRGSDVPGYDKYNTNLQRAHQLLIPLTRKIWKNASQIIAVTNSLKNKAFQTDDSHDIHVIPNGIDSVFFKNPISTKTKDNCLKLIAVARLIERKGIQDILSALAELRDPEINLLIAGSGNYEHQLKQLCDDLSLNDVVSFHGLCMPEKLPALLWQSDVFILPSRAEAFGNVFAEAMACGLPVIGSTVGGIPDLVGAENGVLVSPGNVAEIKSAILKMKGSEQLRKQMGKKNRDKMIALYNWERVTQKHVSLYQEKNFG